MDRCPAGEIMNGNSRLPEKRLPAREGARLTSGSGNDRYARLVGADNPQTGNAQFGLGRALLVLGRSPCL